MSDSLVEKAKEVKSEPKKGRQIVDANNEDVLDLVLAYLRGDISNSQAVTVLFGEARNREQNFVQVIGRVIREAVKHGKIEIKKLI